MDSLAVFRTLHAFAPFIQRLPTWRERAGNVGNSAQSKRIPGVARALCLRGFTASTRLAQFAHHLPEGFPRESETGVLFAGGDVGMPHQVANRVMLHEQLLH